MPRCGSSRNGHTSPPVVVFDAEPDRLIAAFQQVFPPDERTLTIGHRTADHVVHATVADDRAGPELTGPELGCCRGEGEGILAPAAPLLGTAQRDDQDDECCPEQHRGKDEQGCPHGNLSDHRTAVGRRCGSTYPIFAGRGQRTAMLPESSASKSLTSGYHRGVSHASPAEPTPDSRTRPAHRRWRASSRVLTPATLVVAVAALGFALAAWLRPAHHGPSYPQSGDAKTNLCAAYAVAHEAVVINTHLADPGGTVPGGHLAVAANARLALLGGGAYLRDVLAAQTAPPADLANAVNSFAATIEQLGVNYLANAADDVQMPLRHDVDTDIHTLTKLCE